jgi:hypothetical protein
MTSLEPYIKDGSGLYLVYKYMVVQREDTTKMGTILLEEVYQGQFVKLKPSETVVG